MINLEFFGGGGYDFETQKILLFFFFFFFFPGSGTSHLPSKRDSFSRDTFLETTITENNKGVVIKEFITGLVEGGTEMGFGSSQTNSVGNT
jgi:hypothetical protein